MRILILLALLTLTAQAQQKKKAKNYPPDIPGAALEVYKTVGDTQLNAYIVHPKGHPNNDARPAIVFFFGGGWNAGSPVQFAPHSEHFAEKGLVAILIDYRVASRHEVKAVSCVEDAKSAIRWVRKHAKRLGVDPDRVVAAGGSAGGHLAAATGTVTKFDRASEDLQISSRPNAMMLFNPACVLGPIEGNPSDWNEKAKGFDERAGVPSSEISPYHHVSKDTPPAIIFHGKADTTVPYRSAELFAEAMQKAGVRCELVGFEDMPHGFFNQGKFENKPYTETLEKADAFLLSLGYLKN